MGHFYVHISSSTGSLLHADEHNCLIGLGILLQGPKFGKNNTYMVSPVFCFKGSLVEGQKIAARAVRQHKAKIIPFHRELVEQGALL
jgi:hypothetical protein